MAHELYIMCIGPAIWKYLKFRYNHGFMAIIRCNVENFKSILWLRGGLEMMGNDDACQTSYPIQYNECLAFKFFDRRA